MSRINRCDQVYPADFGVPGTLEPVLCHVVSRCVRGIHLLRGGEMEDSMDCPREACSDRLAVLTHSYAAETVGHASMENHLHGLLRLDPQLAVLWTELEVGERWLAVHPDRGLSRISDAERAVSVEQLAADAGAGKVPGTSKGVEVGRKSGGGSKKRKTLACLRS